MGLVYAPTLELPWEQMGIEQQSPKRMSVWERDKAPMRMSLKPSVRRGVGKRTQSAPCGESVRSLTKGFTALKHRAHLTPIYSSTHLLAHDQLSLIRRYQCKTYFKCKLPYIRDT